MQTRQPPKKPFNSRNDALRREYRRGVANGYSMAIKNLHDGLDDGSSGEDILWNLIRHHKGLTAWSEDKSRMKVPMPRLDWTAAAHETEE